MGDPSARLAPADQLRRATREQCLFVSTFVAALGVLIVAFDKAKVPLPVS